MTNDERGFELERILRAGSAPFGVWVLRPGSAFLGFFSFPSAFLGFFSLSSVFLGFFSFSGPSGQRHAPGLQPFESPPGQLFISLLSFSSFLFLSSFLSLSLSSFFSFFSCFSWRGFFAAHAASAETCITAKAPSTATMENTLESLISSLLGRPRR